MADLDPTMLDPQPEPKPAAATIDLATVIDAVLAVIEALDALATQSGRPPAAMTALDQAKQKLTGGS